MSDAHMSDVQTASVHAQRRAPPLNWAWPLAIAFGAAQVIAGIVFFFAYNWRDLPDTTKIALPQAGMALAFILFAVLPRTSIIGRIAGAAAMVFIGVSMGVVGQVYQLGADPWRLFAIWAALGAVIAAATRDDAQFALTLIVASAAYFLFADQEARRFIPQSDSLIPAIYAGLGFVILMARETASGGAPGWLRWLMTAAMFVPLVGGAVSDHYHFGSDGNGLFAGGFVSTVALPALVVLMVFAYARWRPDRPVRAMALFAMAIFIAAFGVRVLLLAKPDGFGEAALVLFASAAWVIGVTAVLAIALRRLAAPLEKSAAAEKTS